MSVLLVIIIALLIDRLFGEPRKFHPLVGFGMLASLVESQLNNSDSESNIKKRLKGFFAVNIVVIPFLFIAIYFSSQDSYLAWFFDVLILTLAIGWQSLREHGLAVYTALEKNDIQMARQKIKLIVSRDVENMDRENICKASIESMLENGSDAIFGAIFWFLVAGAPGVLVYRLVNTLDAMWGYKNSRFIYFGWAAARLDDIMNYIPARLTALSYFLVSRNPLAIHCWRTQGNTWKSPNAGPVMAAGAGGLGVLLGGGAVYNGIREDRPVLGAGKLAKPNGRFN